MPSTRSILAGICLAAIFSFTDVLALPADFGDACKPSRSVTPTPTLPLSGDATELPAANLALLSFVAIGRGVQNYTCASPSASPVSVGAIATLFDATSLARSNEAALHALPPMVVYMRCPTTAMRLASGVFHVLGHHYFDAKGTPTFDLRSVKKILYGAKTGDIKAPATSNKGPEGTGAVDWLQLTKKANYTSIGESVAYRVVTAGGVAPNCTSAGSISVQYAAEYWFFE